MPERDVDEPFDDSLEWERDGQYFHYLTKWMYALDQLAGATRDPRYSLWSRELAEVAHRRFVYDAPGSKRMYWKMSVDLTRPQVPSMGHHDPLDGYVTSLQLEATARQLALPGPDLAEVTADYKRMTDPQLLATADPLGIGGLLVDAFRLTQIDEDRGLRDELLAAARVGLASYLEQPDLAVPAEYRLAFRELGLAIGLAAIDVMNVSRFERFAGLREAINAFWLEPEHRRSHTYRTHEDINDVMLATSLAPTGLLALQASAV